MAIDNTINGRTPEEIKHWLSACNGFKCPGRECPYFHHLDCNSALNADALAYIQQLERERDEARRDADKLKHAAKEATDNYFVMLRERDAAVEDMKDATLCGCHVCGYYYQPDPAVREYACRKFGSFKEHDFISDDGSIFCGAFIWRGPQEVN